MHRHNPRPRTHYYIKLAFCFTEKIHSNIYSMYYSIKYLYDVDIIDNKINNASFHKYIIRIVLAYIYIFNFNKNIYFTYINE